MPVGSFNEWSDAVTENRLFSRISGDNTTGFGRLELEKLPRVKTTNPEWRCHVEKFVSIVTEFEASGG
jgi:hypothetical protein